MKFISHRGESIDAPENTVAAFLLSVLRDTDGFECDLRLSRDHAILVIHDADTNRVGSENLTVAEHSAELLRQIDVGAKKNPRFAGERIPTFAELAELRHPGRTIYAEIKCGPEIIPFLKPEITRLAITPDELIFIAFAPAVISALRQELPAFRACLLLATQCEDGRTVTPSAAEVIQRLQAVNASGLDIQARPEFDRAYVDAVKKAGFEFHVWTIDDPILARQFEELGVDSITSNRAAELKALWLNEK